MLKLLLDFTGSLNSKCCVGEITHAIRLQKYNSQDTLAPYYRCKRVAVDFYNLSACKRAAKTEAAVHSPTERHSDTLGLLKCACFTRMDAFW